MPAPRATETPLAKSTLTCARDESGVVHLLYAGTWRFDFMGWEVGTLQPHPLVGPCCGLKVTRDPPARFEPRREWPRLTRPERQEASIGRAPPRNSTTPCDGPK